MPRAGTPADAAGPALGRLLLRAMAGEFLRVVRGPKESAEIRVPEAGEVVLGREVDGAGYLGESPEVSRRHARLTRAADGGLMLQDLGSLNGTLVNGERMTSVRRLEPGDTVRIGDALLAVVDATGRGGQPTAYARETPAAPHVESAAAPARSRLLDPQNLILAAVMVVVAVLVFLLLT